MGIRFAKIVLLGIFLGAAIVEAKPTQFPKVAVPRGKVWVRTQKKIKKTLQVADILLRDSAEIETGKDSEVFLLLKDNIEILVLAESELVIPSISWESADLPNVILKKGRVIWQSGEAQNKMSINSDLFAIVPSASRFMLGFDPIKAQAEMLVLSGEQKFSALNYEEVLTLKAGQRASFQGEFEEGEIAYDLLLKGKKVPKGQLSPAVNAGDKEIQIYRRDSLATIRQREEARRKKQEELENQLLPGQVCRKPNAKFNECQWLCEGNPKDELKRCRTDLAKARCVRKRCNANGVWAEETALSPEDGAIRCTPKPAIGKCDY